MSRVFDQLPKPLTFREKVKVIVSVLRNERWRSYHGRRDTSTLYTFQPYAAEVVFQGGYVFRFQWYGKPEYATAKTLVGKCREFAMDWEPETEDGPRPMDLLTEDTLFSARLIRRRDFSVTHVAGKDMS
ncbi:hypothetical protein SEA_ZOOMAN_288 [Microbacterium phage Zooman]|nr:hypothetical protein SEA_ZOOMAN_288 [Microbacterium phage Zooman]